MVQKKMSRAAKVRKLLNEGVKPKEVAQRVGVKLQTVYTIRYMDNKKKGVGALPKPELSKDGIAAVPRKRGRPAKKVIVVPAQTEKREAPKQTSGNGAVWFFIALCGAIIILAAVNAK